MFASRMLTTAVAVLMAGDILVESKNRYTRDTDSCTTSKNEPGYCVLWKKCDFMRQMKITDFQYFRSSVCGIEDDDAKVCCPLIGQTPVIVKEIPTINNKHDLPDRSICGLSNNIDHSRIVGGSPAELGSWPWMAALAYSNRSFPADTYTYWLCGGSLITDKFVLTAAHCVEPDEYKLKLVRLGELDLDDTVDDKATPLDKHIIKKIIHPSYDSKNTKNDIGLLKMDSSVQFTSLIKPICLPSLHQERSRDLTDLTPYVAGWGQLKYLGPRSTRLQQIQVTVFSHQECVRIYRFIGSDSKIICAGDTEGKKDSCQGDSGGPLMINQGAHFYQYAIVSEGYRCSVKGYPGIYTSVPAFIDWITDTIQSS